MDNEEKSKLALELLNVNMIYLMWNFLTSKKRRKNP